MNLQKAVFQGLAFASGLVIEVKKLLHEAFLPERMRIDLALLVKTVDSSFIGWIFFIDDFYYGLD